MPEVTDPTTTPTGPERRRPGIRGSRERLDRTYPLNIARPAPGRGGEVRVRLTGHPADLEKLIATMPGLHIVTATIDPAEAVVEATTQAGVHHYLSTACIHEVLTTDPTVAADLHAYCASESGKCGQKLPHTCKWGSCVCGCPGH